jgi:hypothetical protein
MGVAGLAHAIVSSQGGLKQLQLAASFERMNADQGAAIAKLVDSAQANIKSLANVGTGIGGKVNVSA